MLLRIQPTQPTSLWGTTSALLSPSGPSARCLRTARRPLTPSGVAPSFPPRRRQSRCCQESRRFCQTPTLYTSLTLPKPRVSGRRYRGQLQVPQVRLVHRVHLFGTPNAISTIPATKSFSLSLENLTYESIKGLVPSPKSSYMRTCVTFP